MRQNRAEVAEAMFTAFTSRNKAEQITGRLVVRRIPEPAPAPAAGPHPARGINSLIPRCETFTP
ncbi:MAG TPA: hypothetical protein VLR70_05230 [Arthrobacter sp.]|nr:hypothetical protein [Arthrobacter sp.]